MPCPSQGLEVFLGWRRESLISLDFCQGPEGTSHGASADYPGFPYVGIIIMCLYCILLGGILTYVTEKTGSVWPAAFLHGVNNASPSILAAFMNAEKLSQVSLFKQIVCMVIPFVLI